MSKSIGEQFKEIGFEIELYKSFFVWVKKIVNNESAIKLKQIESQIRLTDRLYNNYFNKEKNNE